MSLSYPPEGGLPPCATCGGQIDSEDQLDLSTLRFRRPMCVFCFSRAKGEPPGLDAKMRRVLGARLHELTAEELAAVRKWDASGRKCVHVLVCNELLSEMLYDIGNPTCYADADRALTELFESKHR